MQSDATGETGTAAPAGLSNPMTMMFAVAGGLSVANIYYAQPLLGAMATDFGLSPAAIGIVVTMTQIGYALGLIFITPLGDILNRRRLIAVQALLLSVALMAAAFAPNAGLFMTAMAAVGLLSVLVQTLIAFAAVLATRWRAAGPSALSPAAWSSASSVPASSPGSCRISAGGERFTSALQY